MDDCYSLKSPSYIDEQPPDVNVRVLANKYVFVVNHCGVRMYGL